MRGRKIPKGTAIALIVGGDLVLLMLGWFLLVSPQRATAKSNAQATQATLVQIEQVKLADTKASKPIVQPRQPEIQTAYLYKLSKAMPMTTDMPNLLLELRQVVRSAGVKLNSISPPPPDVTGITGITLPASAGFYVLPSLLCGFRSLVPGRDGP